MHIHLDLSFFTTSDLRNLINIAYDELSRRAVSKCEKSYYENMKKSSEMKAKFMVVPESFEQFSDWFFASKTRYGRPVSNNSILFECDFRGFARYEIARARKMVAAKKKTLRSK
jgi:hypothetical protein